MKPTKLQWEDVIQLEEVKGYGQHIWRDGNNLYYVTRGRRIAPQRVVYALPNEFCLIRKWEKSRLEVLSKTSDRLLATDGRRKEKASRSNLY